MSYITLLVRGVIAYVLFLICIFCPIIPIVLIPSAIIYLIKLKIKDPQVPFPAKLLTIKMSVEDYIAGVYSENNKFDLYRFNRYQKLIGLLGMSNVFPDIDPPNTYMETIQVPSSTEGKTIEMKIYIKNSIYKSEKKQPIIFYLFPGAFHLEIPCAQKEKYIDAGFIFVALRYRLAPEHKFPVPLEDSFSALAYIAQKKHPLIETYWDSRVVVMGESAGGSLTAGLCLLVRDRQLKINIISQIIYYAPFFMNQKDLRSHIDYKNWYIHGEAKVKWVDHMYMRDDSDYDNVYLSPVKAKDLTRLPAAYICLAERDYFCSEGELYYEKLKEAGNEAVIKIFSAEHGFLGAPGPESEAAVSNVIAFLEKRIT